MTTDHYADLLSNSQTLRYADLRDKDIVVTIKKVHSEFEFTGQKGRKEVDKKALTILTAGGKEKFWILGPTVINSLRLLLGNKPSQWVDKKVTLWPDHEVMLGKAKVGGVRVRPQLPADSRSK